MKSLLWSVGQICLVAHLWALASGRAQNSLDSGREKTAFSDQPSTEVQQELREEISLKADRSHLDELRKEVPEEKRAANDELAIIAQMISEARLEPSIILTRYQTMVKRRRDEFRRKMDRLRENFKMDEKRRRDRFLKEAKSERDSFKRFKQDREATKEFFAQQEAKRRAFFDEEKDRRRDFESEMKAQNREFDHYMRDRHNEFHEQLRLYKKKYELTERERRDRKK